MDEKIDNLEKFLETKEIEIDQLNHSCYEKTEKINQLEQFKRDVLHSKSWRYTEFIRKLKNRLFSLKIK